MNAGSKRCIKILLGIGMALAVLAVVALLAISFYLGPIIKHGAENFGPRFLGVPVRVEAVNVRPFRGMARIQGVVIGNPEGFQTASAFELGELNVDVSLASLRTDTIVIRRVLIKAPKVTYELRGRRTNITTILENLQKDRSVDGDRKSAPPSDKPLKKDVPAKKVILEHFVFEEGRLGMSTSLAGGRQLTTSLPRIELNDVGRASGGLAAADLAYQVFTSIAASIGRGVVDLSGQIAGQSAEALRDLGSTGLGAAVDAADILKDGAGSVLGTPGGESGRRAAKEVGRAVSGLLGRGAADEKSD